MNILTAIYQHQSKDFGYLKILSFRTEFEEPSIGKQRKTDMTEICRRFPSTGLIIDVGGNTGGLVEDVFQILGWISAVDEFVLYGVRSSSRRLASFYEKKVSSTRFRDAIVQAYSIGEQCTAPIEHRRKRTNLQVYKGPIIVLVDCFTVSAGELFTSLIIEYQIGRVIGVDATTTGSTASVTDTEMEGNFFFERFTLADRVTIRGPYEKDYVSNLAQLNDVEGEGTETVTKDIEHVGVKPDEQYFLTKDDILHDNVDLFVYIARNFFLNDGHGE